MKMSLSLALSAPEDISSPTNNKASSKRDFHSGYFKK